MKQFVFLLLLTSYSVILFSQTPKKVALGVNGGITYSNVTGSNDYFGNYDYNIGYETGLHPSPDGLALPASIKNDHATINACI